MNFFEIVLSPFIFIIKQIFLFSYSITNDYGAAIILLSFAISLLLLPVFILIEKAKKKDDALKLKMKPLVDEIKRCYKGQERYYYLKTLNRQHNYSPLRALFPVLSLLLQIPFFIAAYQFLESFTALQGVSFLFISDLSLPDGLLGAVNILPIAMTLVNLLTAWFYTRNGDGSERKQMLVVAGIFLVLLFNLPAGLVLYWTMNNVFSFFRLFVTNREVFHRLKTPDEQRNLFFKNFVVRVKATQPKWRATLITLTIISVLIQLNWAFQFNFDDIFLRLILAFIGGFLATVLLVVLSSVYKIEWSGKFTGFKDLFLQLWPLFKSTFIILVALGVLSQINWALQFNFDDIILRILLVLFASVFVTGVIILIALFFRGYLNYRSKSIIFHFSELKIGYKIFFWILALSAVSSQITWATNYYFDDIIFRLLLAIAGSWVLTVLLANIVNFVKNNPELTFGNIKTRLWLLQPGIWLVFFLFLLIAVSTQINWALHNNFDDLVFRLIGAMVAGIFLTSLFAVIKVIFFPAVDKRWRFQFGLSLFLPLLFLALYFHFAAMFYFSGTNMDLSLIALFIILAAQVIGLFTVLIARKKIAAIIFLAVLLILVVLIIFQVLIVLLPPGENQFVFPGNKFRWLINEDNMYSFINPGIIFSLITLPFNFIETRIKLFSSFKPNWITYGLSVFYLAGFIFLWNPLTIYSSYPEVFDFAAIEILRQNFGLFAISFVGLIGFYLILPSKIKHIWFVILVSLVLISFVHNTIVPIDLGSLQENKFLNENNLAQPLLNYLLEGVLILFAIFIVNLLRRKNFLKPLSFFLLLINLVLISQGFIEASKTESFWKKQKVLSDSSPLISFSKDKENVVFIIADMFHGWYMDKILKENPELKDVFGGFVWYPNTLSISSITSASITPILGGFDYTIDKLNKETNRTLESKVTEVSESFFKKVKSLGFNFTSGKFIYSKIDINTFDTYLPDWHDDWDQWNGDLKIGLPRELGYTILWENAAFYSAPLFLKPKLYNNGRWMHRTLEKNENTTQAKPYNFLRLLPYISNTICDKSSFVYLHSMTSHHPWDIIDDNGKMHFDVPPYKNNKWVIETLGRWIEWMKANGVYDNTKIVLLSDHGPHWNHFNGDIDMDIPMVESANSQVQKISVMGLIALMMVKDFDKKEPLSYDWRFISNADATNILFDENDPTKAEPPLSRTLPSAQVFWKRKIWLESQVRIAHKYRVKDNIFNMNNWEKLE